GGIFRDAVSQVRNPLPACGGTDPEPVVDARMFAPLAFRHGRVRSVTAADYGELAGVVRGVQRAAAALSWTGSWYEADVALDPLGEETVSAGLIDEVRDDLERYRRIGHDLAVFPARYVPLDIAIRVCLYPHALRGPVKGALRE